MTKKQLKRKPKSWTGCTLCRTARRKCTEEKPQCAHCVRNGYDCQYDMTIRFRVEEFVTVNDKIKQKSRKLEPLASSSSSKISPSASLSFDGLYPRSRSSTERPVDTIETPEPGPSANLVTEQCADSRASAEDELLRRTSFVTRAPIWTEAQVDPIDGGYFHFFVEHMRGFIPYMNLFPKGTNEIFARTLMSAPLRHAVLAISSVRVDAALNRPLTRALIHKQDALKYLQQGLSAKQVDEDIAIAIFLMLFMDTFAGKDVAQAHLRGLSLVLKELNVDSSTTSPLYWDKVSPIVLLIWRIAFRLDALVATLQDTSPIFPPFPFEYNLLQRDWALRLAKDRRSADWGVASFAIDTMFQRANYLRWFAHVHGTDEYLYDAVSRARFEAFIREKIDALSKEHAAWLEQPAIAMAFQLEDMSQETELPSNAPQFLDYPPRIIHDRKFNLILNEWRGQYLFFQLVLIPISMRRHSRTAIHHAIEICRTHAAIDLEPSSRDWVSEFMSLLTAGHAFIGGTKFQKEFDWVYREINRAAGLNNPLLSKFRYFVDKVRGYTYVAPMWMEFDED